MTQAKPTVPFGPGPFAGCQPQHGQIDAGLRPTLDGAHPLEIAADAHARDVIAAVRPVTAVTADGPSR